MYPGLPSRMEREIKQLYLENVLKGDTSRLQVRVRGLCMELWAWERMRCGVERVGIEEEGEERGV